MRYELCLDGNRLSAHRRRCVCGVTLLEELGVALTVRNFQSLAAPRVFLPVQAILRLLAFDLCQQSLAFELGSPLLVERTGAGVVFMGFLGIATAGQKISE